MTDHPITPPPELVQQWWEDPCSFEDSVKQAARWGADQQLQLDARWLDHNALNETHLKITPIGDVLKEAMRPKPPSLKEQGLKALDSFEGFTGSLEEVDTIRRALEQLE